MTFLNKYTALQCDDLIRTEELATLLNHNALVWSERLSGPNLLHAFFHRMIRQAETLQWRTSQSIDTDDVFKVSADRDMEFMERIADILETDTALCYEFPDMLTERTPRHAPGENIPAMLRYIRHRLRSEERLLVTDEAEVSILKGILHIFGLMENTRQTFNLNESRISLVRRQRRAEFGPVEPRLVSFIALPDDSGLLPLWQARYPTVKAGFLNPATAISRHFALV